MTTTPVSALQVVQALIESEPAHDDVSGSPGSLGRLCRAAVRGLPASGVGLSVMASPEARGITVASSPASELVEELQFTLGEGPGQDAYATREPVLAEDLSRSAARWPAYAQAVRGHGIEAVFAFPLGVGRKSLGVLGVYRDRPGALTPPAQMQAVTFAEVATQTILDEWEASAQDGGEHYFEEDAVNRLELYQAQGMITVQLGIGLAEAMSRLRAHAFARDRRLGAVAHDIVTRELAFPPDDEG